ncbi:GNAT family N-acetyltransferase [Streptomyces sp. NBC_00385]|uniref:GNAT family N-acetyltransferase n=1 Tax=Streptomyces sp. NBC_00385 TaxID=2975733 RepID=UPI002DD8CCCF|nr:GNAT family N-acetyltransferase [Streptomyces sp. NBC_00385]WRZ02340.1 GNAT family N-acetyltransferase [Streptomyces sp. NBC_00385]
MESDPLMARARSLWESLAGVPVSFASAGGPTVVTAPASALAPPGWVGIVLLGDSALATAPTDDVARTVRRALTGLPAPSLTRPGEVARVWPVTEVLGPATLAYLSADDFHPASPGSAEADRLPADHGDLLRLLASVSEEDAGECGLDEITSPAFVVRDGAAVVAAAGYGDWPGDTAHLCVLTAPRVRGRGLARQVASAATAHALAAGRLPQWRARPAASRRVAGALGFRESGSQLSVRGTQSPTIS